ncbi:hypothetical protein AN958_07442 [Leucoagaricus sp. SymC.cos]|nr:hypothetical protein AN958_07442 [Leucoagaricus sp. SymC.cos]
MTFGFLKQIFPSNRGPGPDHTHVPAEVTSIQTPNTPGLSEIINASKRRRDYGTSGSGFFSGAHNFKIRKSTFTEVHGNQNIEQLVNRPFSKTTIIQNVDSGTAVFLFLNQKRVSGAEFDSSDRDPPYCHPQTRKELREALYIWLTDASRRSWDFVWLWGPAGVGKSAVAQAFAEQCNELGLLGAAFFFSAPAKRDSLNGVIATIAYQLATRDAQYKILLTQILNDDPSILDKKLRIQFQQLIVEPFAYLSASFSPVRKPLVVIIDGLDECSSQDAQCELIKLIGEYVERTKATSGTLLWLICSRPEWHIKRAFAEVDTPIESGHEELTCRTTRDIEDVCLILKDGLQKIYDDVASPGLGRGRPRVRWPTETKLGQISIRVGGLPVFADALLRFIDDKCRRERVSPDSQLEACLMALENVSDWSKVNPLDILDRFYLQIVSRVPPSFLPTTKKIIGLQPFLESRKWDTQLTATAFNVAQLLCLDEHTFYAALQDLHSVLDIPPPESAHEKPVKAFHKSFMDFLENPHRSGSHTLDMSQLHYDVGVLVIPWYNYFLRQNCFMPHSCPILSVNAEDIPAPAWPDLVNDQNHDSTIIQKFVEKNSWDLWCVRDEHSTHMLLQLQKFTFCHLPHQFDEPQVDRAFSRFLTWYQTTSIDIPLIRQTSASSDELQLTKSNMFLSMETWPGIDLAKPDCPYIFFSSHHDPRWLVRNELPMFFIGNDEKAVLVLGHKRSIAPNPYRGNDPQSLLDNVQYAASSLRPACHTEVNRSGLQSMIPAWDKLEGAVSQHWGSWDNNVGVFNQQERLMDESGLHSSDIGGLVHSERGSWESHGSVEDGKYRACYVLLSELLVHWVLNPTAMPIRGLSQQEAQNMVDFLNKVFDDKNAKENKRRLFFLLINFMRETQVFPTVNKVENIHCDLPRQASEGGLGIIYRGMYRGTHSVCVKAVQMYEKRDVRPLLRAHASEIILWARLTHHNVVPFYGMYLSGEFSSRICLVLPWMENKTLSNYLHQNAAVPRLPLLLDVATGLQYLHESSIIHGDLRAVHSLAIHPQRMDLSNLLQEID